MLLWVGPQIQALLRSALTDRPRLLPAHSVGRCAWPDRDRGLPRHGLSGAHAVTGGQCIVDSVTGPSLTAFAGTLWNGYRPGRAQIAGLAVSALGAGVILSAAGGSARIGLLDLGTAWMLGAIGVWAAYSLLLRHRPQALPQDVTLTASILAGLAVMLPILWITGVRAVPLSPPVVGAILYIVIFASVLGFLLWSTGVARLGPEQAGQFLHLMPVFGELLAVLLLGQQLRPAHGIGAGLTICGIVLVNRPVSITT